MTSRKPPRVSCIVAVYNESNPRTLCGKRASKTAICQARFVQAHIDGHNPAWCETCLALWRGVTP